MCKYTRPHARRRRRRRRRRNLLLPAAAAAAAAKQAAQAARLGQPATLPPQRRTLRAVLQQAAGPISTG